jgi:molecular chaperone GrpE
MTDEKNEKAPLEAKPPELPKAETPVPPEAEVADVEALKARAKERDEFLDLAQRARAELINYRKRVERDRAEWTDRAVADFALSILSALDDFDRALKEAESAKDPKTMLEGFRQVDRKFHVVFKAAGLESFAPHGKSFDPAEHEAVVIEQTDKHPHHSVSEVMRKGWRLRGKLLRPAQVKVAQKPEPREPKAGESGEKSEKES